MKDYRVYVETNDGCCTIWYERSKAKNGAQIIHDTTYNRLIGLNIKRVEVSLIS